jgi:hypothetical protein
MADNKLSFLQVFRACIIISLALFILTLIGISLVNSSRSFAHALEVVQSRYPEAKTIVSENYGDRHYGFKFCLPDSAYVMIALKEEADQLIITREEKIPSSCIKKE